LLKLRENPCAVPSIQKRKEDYLMRKEKLLLQTLDASVPSSIKDTPEYEQMKAEYQQFKLYELVLLFLKETEFGDLTENSLDTEKFQFNAKAIQLMFDVIGDYEQTCEDMLPESALISIDKSAEQHSEYGSERLKRNQFYVEWEEAEMIRYAKISSHKKTSVQ
jgi:hypothetical protein